MAIFHCYVSSPEGNPIQEPQLDEPLTSDALDALLPRCQGLHRVRRRSRFDLFKDLRDVIVEGHQMHSLGMRQAYSPSSVHDFWGNFGKPSIHGKYLVI